MLKREDIRIRDPFILTDRENGCYYMYGTTALEDGSLRAKNSFSVYRTCDPECFEEPVVIFDGGHAMLFCRLDGERMISLHTPNKAGPERACFLPWNGKTI